MPWRCFSNNQSAVIASSIGLLQKYSIRRSVPHCKALFNLLLKSRIWCPCIVKAVIDSINLLSRVVIIM